MLTCAYTHTIMGVATQTEPLETSIRQALAELDAQPVDAGAVELALTYARAIDSGDELAKLGPALLAVLDALGMTPKARSAVAKGGAGATEHRSPLDELRARRARRDSAPPVDTTA
jgi:hypothetical protein